MKRFSPRLMSLAALALGAALIAGACVGEEDTPAPANNGSTPAASAGGSSAGASAAASLTIATTNDPTLGAYLTANGMTLYVYGRDPADLSICSLDCATTWPPVPAALGAKITPPAGVTGTFGTITRSDGNVQVTYADMPLYFFSGDSAAGDTKGAGKDGAWFVAPVSGVRPSAPPTPAPSTT